MFQCLRTIALVATIILNCGFAFAGDIHSANDVMPGCRALSSSHVPGELYFDVGYCAGLIDGLVFGNSDVCPPADATHEQGLRVVVKYIDDRPARLHEEFYKLALEALRAAFPCKH
jgi:hypothetical protein